MSCFQFVILNCCFLFPTFAVMCLVAQSCLILCDPMDCSPARLLCPWGFSRQEYWSRLPCPPPGHLPDPGIEPRSPPLQMDSLTAEPPGKPLDLRLTLNIVSSRDPWLDYNCRLSFYKSHIRDTGSENLHVSSACEGQNSIQYNLCKFFSDVT